MKNLNNEYRGSYGRSYFNASISILFFGFKYNSVRWSVVNNQFIGMKICFEI